MLLLSAAVILTGTVIVTNTGDWVLTITAWMIGLYLFVGSVWLKMRAG